MQNASTTVASVPLSNTGDCQVLTSQNDDSFSEVKPVNLAAYGSRFVEKSGVDILQYPSDIASYSGYSQNADSPTKFNRPIDLAVSAPRDRSQLNELLGSNDPVNLAAYAQKKLDYSVPSDLSVNEISNVSVKSGSDANQPSASLPRGAVQTVSTDSKDQGTSSALLQPRAYHNTPAVIRTLAGVSSALTQQTGAYPHSLGLTCNAPPASYHSAEWRPALSPRSAQLIVNTVRTSNQPLRADNTPKDGECNPLLLQLQVCSRLSL